MERVATDVAKPPIPGGDLPSFEELLAKGSFQARLAEARASREKALADSADAGDCVLNTSRKPWERGPGMASGRDRLVDALDHLATTDRAAPAAAPRGPVSRAEPEPVGGDEAANVVPIRPAERLRPVPPRVADIDLAVAQAHQIAVAERAIPDLAAPGISEPVVPGAPVAATSSRARRYAAMVGGGFLGGLVIGVAVTITVPRLDAPAPTRPATSLAAPAASPPPPARVAAATVPVSAVDVGMALSPGLPAADAIAPAPLDAADALERGAPPVFARLTPPAAAPRAVAGLQPGAAPDATPAARVLPASPTGLDRPVSLASPGISEPAGPAAVPRPVARPALSGQAVLAAAPPADVAVAGQANPPAAAPGPAGPITVNAPESIGEAELAAIVDGLGAAGFVLAGPHRVDLRISESNVRFFHPGDAATARAVAAELGARLRDFTDFSPAPPKGTIEVWLAGRGSAPAAAPAKPSGASGQGAITAEQLELNLLRNRILQQLRSGAHL